MTRKFLVIGNPIDHSLSPKLHNHWIKDNNINAIYEKRKLESKDLDELIVKIKKKEIYGVNVTVPFKKEIISYLHKLTPQAESTQSVNTIYMHNDEVTGHNTDIDGFELGFKNIKLNIINKKVLILGAGGVVPSIIFALNKMKVFDITVSNRTKDKADDLKNLFKDLKVVNWGNLPSFDIIINATSIGLNKHDKINLDFTKIGKGKLFYDVIYNPKETDFLKTGKKLGNITENGKKMFIFQAAAAFKIWHNDQPKINEELFDLLDK